MAANAIIVTGKAGNAQQLTAQRINAVGDIIFKSNGNVSINGQDIDLTAITTVTCAVTAGVAATGTPPVLVFTIS